MPQTPYLRIPIIISLLLFTMAISAAAQRVRLNCPAGTKYKKEPALPATSPWTSFPQFEEYCQKTGVKGYVYRQGPARVWGPNGETLEEGSYAGGKKNGPWMRLLPSQILKDTWKKGKFIDSAVVGTPSSFTIDFNVCIPHEYGIPAAFGSTLYRVLGKAGGLCKMTYSIEIEMGQGPHIDCRVPSGKGKLVFFNTAAGLNFLEIAPYCKQ